jgi:hypothetical protein
MARLRFAHFAIFGPTTEQKRALIIELTTGLDLFADFNGSNFLTTSGIKEVVYSGKISSGGRCSRCLRL